MKNLHFPNINIFHSVYKMIPEESTSTVRCDTFIFVRSKYKGRVPKRKIRGISYLWFVRVSFFLPSVLSSAWKNSHALSPLWDRLIYEGAWRWARLSYLVCFWNVLQHEGWRASITVVTFLGGVTNFQTIRRYIHSNRENGGFYEPMKVCQSSCIFHVSALCFMFHVSNIYNYYRLMIDMSFLHNNFCKFIKDIFDKSEIIEFIKFLEW